MRNSVKVAIGAVLAGTGGLVIWWQTQPAPVVEPVAESVVESPAEPAAEPALDPAVAEAPDLAPEPEPEPAPAAVAQFDVVRVAPDGQAVIAGQAAPGQTVEILLDGAVIGTAEADATGAFATVLEVPLSDAPRELTLRTALTDAPEDVVALAPTADKGVGEAAAEAAAAEAAAAERAAAEAAAAEQAAAEAAAAYAAAAEAAAAAAASAAAEVAAAEAAAAEAAAAEAAAAEAAAAKAAAAEAAAAEAAAAEAAAAEAAAAEVTAAEQAAAEAAAAEAAAAAQAAAAEAAAAEASAEAAAAEAAAAEAVVAAAKRAAELVAASVEPEVSRFALSSPVIILPQEGAEQAPILVKPGPEGVTLLQPAMTAPAAGIVLDRITYSEQGDLLAAGRGQAGAIIRVYANARFVEEVRCDEDGKWQVRIASDVAATTQLLRFDEVDAEGTVLSRLETPFEYSPLAITQELRERKIVVQKGDYLWKFAEQYYGEGIRYSVIFSANSALIRDPDLIYPGQVFTVPELVDSR